MGRRRDVEECYNLSWFSGKGSSSDQHQYLHQTAFETEKQNALERPKGHTDASGIALWNSHIVTPTVFQQREENGMLLLETISVLS